MATTTCICPRLSVGMAVTEARNWNPDCPAHGVDTEWYVSARQRATREADDHRVRAMQAEARRLRKGGLPKATCRGCGSKHYSWETFCDDYDPVGPVTTI